MVTSSSFPTTSTFKSVSLCGVSNGELFQLTVFTILGSAVTDGASLLTVSVELVVVFDEEDEDEDDEDEDDEDDEELPPPPQALKIIVSDAAKTIDRDPFSFISESFQYEI